MRWRKILHRHIPSRGRCLRPLAQRSLSRRRAARDRAKAPVAENFALGERLEKQRGFTLIEMIVSVALFAVVMLVSVGALLALVSANRKAQALQSVMNNLNVALDSMVRSVRMGSTYHCGSGAFSTVQDCSSTTDDPANHYILAIEAYGGDESNPLDQWVYRFDPDGSVCNQAHSICKSTDSGAHYLPIIAPEVSIDSLQFYVIGTTRGDAVQPKVLIEVKGTAGAAAAKTKTTFSIEATAVQRLLDL